MSPSDEKTISLRIAAATPLTEITVSDSQFRKIAVPTNTGVLELKLPAGVYEVGFRDGTSIQQELVVLSPEQEQPVLLTQATPTFSEDYDLDLSEDPASQAPSLALIVRDPLDGPQSPDTRFDGLDLVDAAGSSVVSSRKNNQLLFDVSPGPYRLRLQTGLGNQIFETPIVACPGWSLRASCRAGSYGPDVYRADLTTIQVRMYPTDGSRRRSREERALESNALAALAGRRTLSGQAFKDLLRGLLNQKYVNPMFGFYAGYLLRGTDADEIDVLAQLVAHLEALVEKGPDRKLTPPAGFQHPDVEALKLRLRMLRKESMEDVAAFPFPPMLFAGWRTILQVAERSKNIIPAGSLSDRISSHLVAAGASLLWTTKLKVAMTSATEATPLSNEPYEGAPRRLATRRRDAGAAPPPAETTTPHSQAEVISDTNECIRIISAALHDRRMRDWFRNACGMDEADNEEEAPQARVVPIISDAEKMIAQAIHPIATKEQFQSIFERTRLATGAGPRASSPPELAAELRLPVTTVERAIQEISTKLLQQGQLLGIDLRRRATMSRPELIIPYDPSFLGDGFTVPIPSLSDTLRGTAFADGAVLDYTHYSLIMHTPRRVAIVTAHNVDASRAVRVKGGLTWRLDERAGDHQLGPETYDHNQLDKGHLVRREDVLWGTVPEAKLANKATYFYTNAAPQHKNFNQDEWVALEDWVLDKATEFSYRLCVFTGPVLRSNDPVLTDLPPNLRTAFRISGPAQIPAAFWKVVVLRDAQAAGEDLSVVAFAMRQSEMWNDRDGRRLLSLKVHQVTLSAIEGWTGLDFGELKNADELAWSEERTRAAGLGEEPEWPLVREAADIVYSGPTRRLRGLRAIRRGASTQRSATIGMPGVRDAGDLRAAPDCGCNGNAGFDAREAVAALSREVARLTEVVAAQAVVRETPAEPAPPTTRSTRARSATARRAEPVEDTTAPDDERVQRMVEAVPDAMKDAVRAFARTVNMQYDVARGVIAVPPPSELERIVGGNRVQTGAIPSCVCIGSATDWFCTGVVVAPQVVLTAAHCGGDITRILIGDEVTPSPRGRIVAVRRAIVHPSYRRDPRNENDINVLILDTLAAIPPSRVATAAQLGAATTVHLVGFGYNDPQLPKGFGTKREVKVPMGPVKRSDADDLTAFENLTGFHAQYEFVAGRKGLGKDTCNGDSGGPAYVDTNSGPVVAGLTSRATRDADVPCGAGGIYVRVDMFREWINGVLSSNGLSPLP